MPTRPPSRRLHLEHLEPRLAPSGAGLTAQYFHNIDFTGLAGTRTEAIAHDWGTGSPGFGIGADNFSVRWTGQIEPQFSQVYTFRIVSDEGVRVWIDGRLLIDDWEPHTVRARFATMALEGGRRYDIRVDYFDMSGPAQIELSWSSASQPMQQIPATRMHESPAGLLGTYRDAADGHLSRVDAAIDFNWGTGAPGPGIAAEGFTVNWTGQIRAEFADEYTFSINSDDGVRLWIGGELVIDNGPTFTANHASGLKRLEPGKWYDLRLEYFENEGPAGVVLRWSSPRQTGEGAFDVVPHENFRATMPHAFRNPLGPGADPWVFYWEGNYYMTRSQGNSVWINRAESLHDIHHTSPRSQTTVAWSAPPGTNYSSQIWAPELHRMGSNWYIYVAASDGNNATHRMHVLERNADDPFGPYVYLGQITPATDRWAIDGTVFKWENVWYFVWSGWPGFTDGQQNLYIAQMRNPWTLHTDRVLLSTPEFAWEKHGLAINEGPQVLVHDGQLHIIYSASGYWTPQYSLGRLTYSGTGSLLDPASWTKAPEPVFRASEQVVGVGHASFVQTPDGHENWIVYHAHANPTIFTENRVIRTQPFTFLEDGTPHFGRPLPNAHWLVVPSAGADPERPFVPGDFNADGTVDDADHGVWRATFGSSVFAGVAADANGDGLVDAADYVLWRRHFDAPAAHTAAVAAVLDAIAPIEQDSANFVEPLKSVAMPPARQPPDVTDHGHASLRWNFHFQIESAFRKNHQFASQPAGVQPHDLDHRAVDNALLHWLEQSHPNQHPVPTFSEAELPQTEPSDQTLVVAPFHQGQEFWFGVRPGVEPRGSDD